jgi:hypothetical protein
VHPSRMGLVPSARASAPPRSDPRPEPRSQAPERPRGDLASRLGARDLGARDLGARDLGARDLGARDEQPKLASRMSGQSGRGGDRRDDGWRPRPGQEPPVTRQSPERAPRPLPPVDSERPERARSRPPRPCCAGAH